MALHTHQVAYLTTKVRWNRSPSPCIKNTRLVRWPQRLSMRSVVPWCGVQVSNFSAVSSSSTSQKKTVQGYEKSSGGLNYRKSQTISVCDIFCNG